jgi:hypothetical protein
VNPQPARHSPAAAGRRWFICRFGFFPRLVFVTFVLQREVFIHFDEDSRSREDKIIHNKVAKPRRENISQQGHKGRKDRPFEFLKSVFVAFAILL